MNEFTKKAITKKADNFAQWYNDVVLKAELADYSPVKGCMVIRPYGYGIWENIQANLDRMIKDVGVENAYFPLFIPQSFLKREKEHVEGFSPELAVVTMAGGKKLEEPLIVRPTSETMMYAMFAKWIQSWRDLPLLINQWGNVVRWEMRTYLFLRTTEFLWQEGHTAHATHEESWNEVVRALNMYKTFVEEYLAIPVVIGVKSEAEKFAGAIKTTSVEMLMSDGKALQAGTSHDLGQNFAKVFDVSFQDKEGKKQYVWQTSWGMTTRLIGGLVMVHGDDQGLIMPPKIAPIQVVIIPIDTKNDELLKYSDGIAAELRTAGIRVKVDKRTEETVGFKFNEWELRGVPVRIEVGSREMGNNEVTIVRRDESAKCPYRVNKVQSAKLKLEIQKLLEEIQKNLFERAKKYLIENTHEVSTYEEFKSIMAGKRGFIKAFWCENPECEKKIKEETKASTRVLPFDVPSEKGKCIYCGKEAKNRWIFAQAY